MPLLIAWVLAALPQDVAACDAATSFALAHAVVREAARGTGARGEVQLARQEWSPRGHSDAWARLTAGERAELARSVQAARQVPSGTYAAPHRASRESGEAQVLRLSTCGEERTWHLVDDGSAPPAPPSLAALLARVAGQVAARAWLDPTRQRELLTEHGRAALTVVALRCRSATRVSRGTRSERLVAEVEILAPTAQRGATRTITQWAQPDGTQPSEGATFLAVVTEGEWHPALTLLAFAPVGEEDAPRAVEDTVKQLDALVDASTRD